MSYIEVSNLQKNFIVKKKHEKGKLLREKEIVNALKGVSFSVDKGELVGYIGPNGAGKSTTVKILSGILTPDGGEVNVGGIVPWKERKKHVKNIDLLGQCFVTDKHVVSVQTDRGTPYNVYFQVQNELVAAYNELRNELSKQKFGREFQYLKEEEKAAIRQYYPQNISEAEPKKYGGDQ